MYVPNQAILDHTFVTGTELLNLYRSLREWDTYPEYNQCPGRGCFLKIGSKLLCGGGIRFPENELYYDLERSKLAVVYSNLLKMEKYTDLHPTKSPELKLNLQNKFEKIVNELCEVMEIVKVDAHKGLYDRKSFEEYFQLKWVEDPRGSLYGLAK